MIAKISTSKRTKRSEILDDFELQGKELQKTLTDLEKINKWLGGNRVTLEGIKKVIKDQPKEKEIHIADVGCGNGAMLREIARWARKKERKIRLTGIDANSHAIEIAEGLSVDFPEIDYAVMDIFNDEFARFKCDLILCTLTLHHFKDLQIERLMNLFNRQARIGVVINDLHRSKVAYRLFQAFCSVFIKNQIARKDGLTSILRGFKKSDLQEFATKIPGSRSEINWKWAFRYQWIIQKKQL